MQEKDRLDKIANEKKAQPVEKSKSNKTQKVTRLAQNAAQSFGKALTQNKVSKYDLLMRRKAQAARMRQVAMQTKGAIQQVGYDNKFERRLYAQQVQLNEDERHRRFTEVPDNFEERKDAIKQLRRRLAHEWELRNNLLRAHKQQFQVKLNLLGVDNVTNLAKTAPIWNTNNPDNNVFVDNGRPTILDSPNAFAVTPETQKNNIINAPKLNWGQVDTRRRPRRYIPDPNQGQF